MFDGELTTYEGEHFQLHDMPNLPAPGAAAAAADPRRRCRRAAHAPARRAVRRRVERADVRARRARPQARGARRGVRAHRARPVDDPHLARGGDGARAPTTPRSPSRSRRRSAGSPVPGGGCTRAATSARRPRSSIASVRMSSAASRRSSSSRRTVPPSPRSGSSPTRSCRTSREHTPGRGARDVEEVGS